MRVELGLLCRWSLIACLATATSAAATRPRPNILKRTNPSYFELTDASLAKLANLTNLDTILDFNEPSSLLSRLLVPRVAGSPELAALQTLVSSDFSRLGWHTERDSFTANTPYGPKVFTNLIFTHDPKASRKLVLSAHLDSKYFEEGSPEFGFVGATDSAAPCAILLDLAEALTPWLDARKKRVDLEGGEVGGNGGQGETLQIVFFDGEEAFKDWTAEDSIYGAKHLAEVWSKPDKTPAVGSRASNPLSRISHLILLDLLGAPSPIIRSFYKTTGWLFDEFAHSERRLGEAGSLWAGVSGTSYAKSASKSNSRTPSFFVPRDSNVATFFGVIEDDHIPFARRGVPIVHLIATPFPPVWHTIRDDKSALDLPTIKAWALIVRLTVAEYLGLDPELNTKARRSVGEL